MQQSNATAWVLKALYVPRGQLTEAEAAHLVGLTPSWFRHDFKIRWALSIARTIST
jgi:hypothetical protein